jgi:serine protease
MDLPSSALFARACLVSVACGAWLVLTGDAQDDPLRGARRAVVQDGGLPGIDRGPREQGSPRDPAGRSASPRASLQRSDAGTTAGYRRDSIIVKFRDNVSATAAAGAMREVGGSMSARPAYADFDIVDIPLDADPEVVSAELRARPDVEYAQPRYLAHAMARPNDPLYGQQWSLNTLEMEAVWDIQPAAGDQIIVAVLDTGVAFRTTTVRYRSPVPFRIEEGGVLFPALGIVEVPFAVAPELGTAKFVAPRDFVWDDLLPLDLDGHGTHVAGSVGQLTNNGVGVAGMAYNVRIMPVKVLNGIWDDVFESPFFGTDDVVARGIRYAADNGARVINMSLGRERGGPAPAVQDAIRYAVSRGAFVAVAAGNTFDEGNLPSRYAEPAPGIAGMVAVAAVGRNLEHAYYSTTNTYVEIAAPGGDQRRDGVTGGILQQTLDPDLLLTYELGPQRITPPRADAFTYEYFQGTSMATPHVSAFAALLMQQGITSPAAIEAAMKQFARDLGRPGVDSDFGSGLIQPRTTLRGLGLAR